MHVPDSNTDGWRPRLGRARARRPVVARGRVPTDRTCQVKDGRREATHRDFSPHHLGILPGRGKVAASPLKTGPDRVDATAVQFFPYGRFVAVVRAGGPAGEAVDPI